MRLSNAIAVLSMAAPGAIQACTVCASETGQQVRDGIFNESFLPTFAAVAAPFPVLLLGLALYHFCMPAFRRQSDAMRITDERRDRS